MNMDIDSFGEIMDKFLKENDIKMLIEMPKGTLKAEVRNNCEMPGVVDLYILLNALPSVFETVFDQIENDNKTNQRDIVHAMMKMVENELIERLGL
ncbi:MAG: hypothetical protein U0I41_05665 [Coprococcus sp.]|nr:hypothetical protein [Coprococcus sp.]